MTDANDRVTRAAVEHLLQELSGFEADAKEIARVMGLIDIYIASQTGSMSEPHMHLLMQQAELLLDSGQSFWALRQRQDELERRFDNHTAPAPAEQEHIRPAVELTATERDVVAFQLGSRKPANTISDEQIARLYELFEQGVSESRAAVQVGVSRSSANKYKGTWKVTRRAGPLAEYQAASNELHYSDELLKVADQELAAVISESEDEVAGIRDTGTHFEVLCHNCRQWKGTAMFFRNQKSKTGYETKCRDCRPKPKAAA